DREAADGLGAGEPAALGPFRAAFVAKDPAAQVRVLRLRQGRAAQPILARPGVEPVAVDGQGGDRVALVGGAAVGPAAVPRVAVDVTRLGLARLAGPRVQLPLVGGQGEDED